MIPMRPAGMTVTDVTEKVTEVTEKKIVELLKVNPGYKTTEIAERRLWRNL